jgi:hypothetical protein
MANFSKEALTQEAVLAAEDLNMRLNQKRAWSEADKKQAQSKAQHALYAHRTQLLREAKGNFADVEKEYNRRKAELETAQHNVDAMLNEGYVPEAPVQAKVEPKTTPAPPKPAQRMTATEIGEWQKAPKAAAQDNRIDCPGGCGEKVLPNQATHYVNDVRCICNAERAVASGMSRESVEAAVATQANRLNQ